jgi:hypothetical protein
MHVSNIWAQVSFAVLGGVIAEILHWYLLSRKPEGISAYLPKPSYWIFTAVMVCLGGLMPVFYLSGDASVLLCVQLGATAPIALQKIVSTLPDVVQHQGLALARPTLGSFISW